MPQKDRLQAKSYTGIEDIFGPEPFNNLLCKFKKNTISSLKMNYEDSYRDSSENSINYITSEKYHNLNKMTISDLFVHSSSTIFCDLDDVAKKNSSNYVNSVNTDMKTANGRINVFCGNDAIVQNCSTHVNRKLKLRNSSEHISKKHVTSLDHSLSSELILREEDYLVKKDKKRKPKYTTSTKYYVEYMKPFIEENWRKREQGKRTQKICPCQLFSYVFPYPNKNSSTAVTKDSRSVTSLKEITTNNTQFDTVLDLESIEQDQRRNDKLAKSSKIDKYSIVITENDIANNEIINRNNICKKKHKTLVCPHCKEKVTVPSITEDDTHSKVDSDNYKMQCLPSTTAYNCCTANYIKNRSPRYEYQLERDMSSKYVKKKSTPKPRTIRITKACRHHPPCPVAPSCQRLTVIKNKCDYIPPCPHRPRCINLPLCLPISKRMVCNNDYSKPTDDEDIRETQGIAKYQDYKHHRDNTGTSVKVMHNILGALPKHAETINMKNPPNPIPAFDSVNESLKSNKHCQCELIEHKVQEHKEEKPSQNDDTVIFIRDVGCQFKTRVSPSDESTQKQSTVDNVKMGNHYTGVHSVTCNEKFYSSLLMKPFSAYSVTSADFDCCSPSSQTGTEYKTGFKPESTVPCVAFTCSDHTSGSFKSSTQKKESRSKVEKPQVRDGHTVVVKSRRHHHHRGRSRYTLLGRRYKKLRETTNALQCN